MSHLLLIRHSQSAVDPNRPSHEWGLTPAGVKRCHALAPFVHAYSPDAIYSSAEPKAIETATAIIDAYPPPTPPPLTIRPDFAEHNRQNETWTDDATFKRNVARLFSDDSTLFFGTETAQQARSRFTKAVDDVLDEHPTTTVAITTHGTVITLFLAATCHIDPVPFWSALKMPTLIVLKRPSLTIAEIVTEFPS